MTGDWGAAAHGFVERYHRVNGCNFLWAQPRRVISANGGNHWFSSLSTWLRKMSVMVHCGGSEPHWPHQPLINEGSSGQLKNLTQSRGLKAMADLVVRIKGINSYIDDDDLFVGWGHSPTQLEAAQMLSDMMPGGVF